MIFETTLKTTQPNPTQPHTTPPHPTAPHRTTPHYITLHDTTRLDTTRHDTTRHDTTLYYTTLHYTILYYTTLHYTTLHYTTQHHICAGSSQHVQKGSRCADGKRIARSSSSTTLQVSPITPCPALIPAVWTGDPPSRRVFPPSSHHGVFPRNCYSAHN